MPYERKYKRKRRKRRSKQRRTGTVSVLGGGVPFPPSYLTSHRYSETFYLDPSAGVPDFAYYSCNGLFDPTTAAGGHQPLGFDQMTPLYDHYTVIGSKATIRFFSNGTTLSTGCMMVYSFINDDASATATYDTVLEQSKGVVKPLGVLDGNGVTTITQKFSAKKYFGVSDIKDNNQLKGTSSANPSDGAYFVVGAQAAATGGDITGFYANITIDYITLWTERRSLAQS